MADHLVRAENLRMVFQSGRAKVEAVKDISFTVNRGGSLGLVGESGSGKTTTARIVVGLQRPTAGHVTVDGINPYEHGRPGQRFRSLVQMIFQDPYLSLSPRMVAGDAIGYPLLVRGRSRSERRVRIDRVMDLVRLPRTSATRYPHELSTGQRQRVGIARAIITEPRLIVADEPMSSLDVSLQAQVLNLLSDIQKETGTAYLIVSHDLAVVGQLCDDVIVMQNGNSVEHGPAADILDRPSEPYTKRLVAAAMVGAR